MQDIIKEMESFILQYEKLKNEIREISPYAEKLIRIIEAESDNPERQIAFLETTKEELLAGADYSKCETIYDMSGVYASHLIDRLGIWVVNG